MTDSSSDNFLVISALGADQTGLVDRLSSEIAATGCNIFDSRMAVLGSEFGIMVLVGGNWGAVAKLETHLPKLAQELDLNLTSRRTELRTAGTNTIPYAVEVVAMDHPGIVQEVTRFFSSRAINVEDLFTGTYPAPHTGTPMFSLHITVGVPANVSIAALRGEFMDFCDGLNLDAMLAPVK